MRAAQSRDGALFFREDGDPDGVPVLFLHALGADHRVWDRLLPALRRAGAPPIRAIRTDLAGHGLSADVGRDDQSGRRIEAYAEDAAAVLDAAAARDAVVVGLSIGGLVAQALTLAAPDRVRALVLMNTGAKIADAAFWSDRAARVASDGLAAMAPGLMERWFTAGFLETDETAPFWRAMLARQNPSGYVAACAALGAADFRDASKAIRAPTLCVGSDEDLSTPPEQMRALTALISGARYVEIAEAGHIAPVEKPDAAAAAVAAFLKEHARG